jgi:hypothetical protein
MSLIRCPACARLISTAFPMHDCLEPGQVRYSLHRKRAALAWGTTPERVTQLLRGVKDPKNHLVYQWIGDAAAEPVVTSGDKWLAQSSLTGV